MSGLRDQLEAIRKTHGGLTPRTVLTVARKAGHPLHDRFEWDDKIAGEKFRLAQAHELIQSVRVSYIKDERPKSSRYYAAVQGDTPQPVYEPVEEIALDPIKRQLLIQQAEREWRQMQARYGDLTEFVELVRASLQEVAA